MSPDPVSDARARIARIAALGSNPEDVSRDAMAIVESLIPSDGYRLFGLDPATGLLNRLLAASRDDAWARHEWLRDIYLSPQPTDYHEYHRLATLNVSVAAFNPRLEACWGYPPDFLHNFTPADHARRYAELRSPSGGVLLARLRAGDRWVAALQVYRRDPRWQFASHEVEILTQLAPIIGETIQAALHREQSRVETHAESGSGVIVLSRDFEIRTSTPVGDQLLAALRDAAGTGSAPLPTAIWASAAKLRLPLERSVAAMIADSRHGPIRIEASYDASGDAIAVVLTPRRAPPDPRIPDHWRLTPQEHRIAVCLLRGMANREIASTLFVTENTVEWHLQHIYEKAMVRSRSQLLAAYFRVVFAGVVEPDGWRASHG